MDSVDVGGVLVMRMVAEDGFLVFIGRLFGFEGLEEGGGFRWERGLGGGNCFCGKGGFLDSRRGKTY